MPTLLLPNIPAEPSAEPRAVSDRAGGQTNAEDARQRKRIAAVGDRLRRASLRDVLAQAGA